MRRLFAIAQLTWKAAFRFRLFWVLSGLLLGAVVLLPLLLKDDQTARGFTQILLTYNLSVITALLGISTLWLACGTLARDIEEAQLQMVAVKPIPRWQIWLGKWIGIMMLDVVLLTVAGASVFILVQWRARNLPPAQQTILRNEIFVARGSAKQKLPDLETAANQAFAETLRQQNIAPADQPDVLKQIREQLKAQLQIVDPNRFHTWTIDLGLRKNSIRDQPLFVRTKFYAAQTNASGSYIGLWQIGTPNKTAVWRAGMNQAADTFHEFQIPANLFDDDGILRIAFVNQNDTRLLFTLEEGMEILYREGSFGLNYARGLGIILCWQGLLAAIGLSAASLLSFPVAAFVSLSLLMVTLSSGTLSTVVSEGSVSGLDHETGAGGAGWIDAVMIPVFAGLLKVINLAQAFSPVDALSTGRSITWGQLSLAVAQIVFLLGGIFAVTGMIILTRRELATAQTNS